MKLFDLFVIPNFFDIKAVIKLNILAFKRDTAVGCRRPKRQRNFVPLIRTLDVFVDVSAVDEDDAFLGVALCVNLAVLIPGDF